MQRAVVQLDLDTDVVERVTRLELLGPALDPLDQLVQRPGHAGGPELGHQASPCSRRMSEPKTAKMSTAQASGEPLLAPMSEPRQAQLGH